VYSCIIDECILYEYIVECIQFKKINSKFCRGNDALMMHCNSFSASPQSQSLKQRKLGTSELT